MFLLIKIANCVSEEIIIIDTRRKSPFFLHSGNKARYRGGYEPSQLENFRAEPSQTAARLGSIWTFWPKSSFLCTSTKQSWLGLIWLGSNRLDKGFAKALGSARLLKIRLVTISSQVCNCVAFSQLELQHWNIEKKFNICK